MDEPFATSSLWDYRRRVADLYRVVRTSDDPAAAWETWRIERDRLFALHPQSAIEPAARPGFTRLPYFSYDPAWRLRGTIHPVEPVTIGAAHSGSGETPMRRFGRVRFRAAGATHSLDMYWLEGYGGGVFLPFVDATAGRATYGGGRYLLDTAKGADLGGDDETIVLDFNFAYHPSCVLSARWSCPLAPAANRLPLAVRAGERLAASGEAPAQTTE